jgi:hypothetical protein
MTPSSLAVLWSAVAGLFPAVSISEENNADVAAYCVS